MIASRDRHHLTPVEYLNWEEHQEIRHEYVAGNAYAMTGGTIPHNAITVNLLALLRSHVRGSSCRVLGADAKVRIAEAGPFFYPDALVTCDDRDKQVLQFVQFPCLVIEVLSPSTEAYDRGAKFAHYRHLESLQEFALVGSESICVDLFRLNERGKWELSAYLKGSSVQFTSVDFACPIEAIYEDVDLIA